MITIAIIAAAVIITLAIVPVIIRMTVGPTILDRTVGADMMFVFALMGLLLYTAATGSQWAVGGMLAITGLGFIGTLAVARFVAREDDASNTQPAPTGSHAENTEGSRGSGGSGGSSDRDNSDRNAGGPAGSSDRGSSDGNAGGPAGSSDLSSGRRIDE